MSEAVLAPAQTAGGNYITQEQMQMRDLNATIQSLKDQLASRDATIATHVTTIGTLTEERDGYADSLVAIDKHFGGIDHDDAGNITVPNFKGNAATVDPSEWETKYNELTGQIAEKKYRDEWNKIAGESVVDPEAAWDMAKWKMEGETPDPEAVKAAMSTLLTSKPYLKLPVAAPTTPVRPGLNLTVPATPPSGTGISRGTPETPKPAPVGPAAILRARMQATGRKDDNFI